MEKKGVTVKSRDLKLGRVNSEICLISKSMKTVHLSALELFMLIV